MIRFIISSCFLVVTFGFDVSPLVGWPMWCILNDPIVGRKGHRNGRWCQVPLFKSRELCIRWWMPYGRSSRTTVSNDDGTVRCCAYVDGSLVGHDICKEQDVAAAVVAHLR
jgi:hypothetical protein